MTKPKQDLRRVLIWDRIKVTDKGLILEVILSKTIQDMSKIQEVPISAQPGSPFCVVSSLKNLTEIPGYPCGPLDPVLSVPDMKGGWIPLTKSAATKVYKNQLREMGLNTDKYGWHSFRRGGMQHGPLVVPNLELLRLHGGWQSEAWRIYMDLPATSRFQVTEMILNSLS